MREIRIRRRIDTDLTRPHGKQHRAAVEFSGREMIGPWETEAEAEIRLQQSSDNIEKEVAAIGGECINPPIVLPPHPNPEDPRLKD